MGRPILATFFFSLLVAPVYTQQGDETNSAQLTTTQGNDGAARQPIPLNHPEAEFPVKARANLSEGSCVISMTVNPDGIPESLHVVSCSDDVFAANSLAAAGKYRFQPALDRSGSPVSTSLKVEVDFQLTKTNEVRADQEPDVLKCEIVAPPGVSSQTPDSYGVYPLSKAIVAPAIARFVDRGFIAKAHLSPNLVACDIFLTIDKKGRAADPKVAHCDEQILEAPAADSLLKSRFRPGLLNGEAVPVRILFHLVYTGSAPKL